MKKAFAVFFALLLGCGTVGTVVDFSTLASGTHAAGITERVNEVFTDQASFEAFWKMISAGTIPEPVAPAVDFSKDMVIAVSPGVMNSGGYTVEITKVTSDGKKLTVTVVVTKPTGIVTMALTQPYYIITLKRTNLPVEFKWEEEGENTETPTTTENPDVYVPMAKGNLARTGSYEAEGVPDLNGLLWDFHMNARGEMQYWYYNGVGAPVISEGVVYAGSSDFNLYAVDAKTGTERWRYSVGDAIFYYPTVSGGVVYAGSDDGFLYAVGASTGKERWRFKTGGDVSSSPAVWRGVVYVGSDDGFLYAVDASTGKERWRFGARSSTPAISGGAVYIGGDGGLLYALDANTGAERWRFTAGTFMTYAPAVSDGVVYVGGDSGYVYAVDAKNGAEKWRFKAGEYACSFPTVSNGVVYVGCTYGFLYAVDASTGKERWRFEYKGLGGEYGSEPWDWYDATVCGGVVYVGNSDGFLYALDASTGKERWRFEVSGGVGSSAVVSGGVVYVQSINDHLYAIH